MFSNKKPPLLILRHLNTKLGIVDGKQLNRYWFEWYERRSLERVEVRISLMNADNVPIYYASVALPKVKVVTRTPDGTPAYDRAIQFHIDLPAQLDRAARIQYRTIQFPSNSSGYASLELTGPYYDIESIFSTTPTADDRNQ